MSEKTVKKIDEIDHHFMATASKIELKDAIIEFMRFTSDQIKEILDLRQRVQDLEKQLKTASKKIEKKSQSHSLLLQRKPGLMR